MMLCQNALGCVLILSAWRILPLIRGVKPLTINVTAVNVFNSLSPNAPLNATSTHGLIVDFSAPPSCSNVCVLVDDDGVTGCMSYEATVVEGGDASRVTVQYEDKNKEEVRVKRSERERYLLHVMNVNHIFTVAELRSLVCHCRLWQQHRWRFHRGGEPGGNEQANTCHHSL